MTTDWRQLSAQQVLDNFPALTVSQVAFILPNCYSRKSDPTESRPSRRKAIDLIRTGALRVVDPDADLHRLFVTSDEVRRYPDSGPRQGADIVPLRVAS